jgi:FtsZ-binding cell division protein ZapB
MLIVAFVVGTIVELMQVYCDQIMEKNRELSEANGKMQALNARLAESGESLHNANKK